MSLASVINRVEAEDSAATPWTLIRRLKTGSDNDAWASFYRIYGPLITALGIRAGLTPEEAKDALQETVMSALKYLPDLNADPAAGSFKSWLLKMARWRVLNQVEKRDPALAQKLKEEPNRGEATATTGTVERIPSRVADWEAFWEEEWRENSLALATERLKRQTSPRQFQIFYLNVVKGQRAGNVAKALGVSIGSVYLARCRLLPRLKKLLRELEG